jgi:queuine tRNA-ribosyltransferase
MTALSFQVLARDGAARRGRLVTPHGAIETPVFMPVGTAATVKTLSPRDLEELGAAIVLGNTYHLYLRPGHERIRRLGGLHRFMGWGRSLLTDSGGFQVFSLGRADPPPPSPRTTAPRTTGRGGVEEPDPSPRGALVSISEEGVEFRSHLDGSRHFLSPELAIAIQEALGTDVAMAFDECPPARADRAYHEASLARTQRWLIRCKAAWEEAEGRKRATGEGAACALFGIAQGGLHADLRRRAIEEAAALDLPGYALGGYAVGEEPEETWAGVARDAPLLPAAKPRYLMGVGTPRDLLAGIAAGVDMFDCVLPTRCARNGLLFTSRGRLTIRNAAFQDDDRPADPSCACYACRTFSRAYLRHLFGSGELLGLRLNTLHNVHYFLALMAGAREAIEAGRFEDYRRACEEGWQAGPL